MSTRSSISIKNSDGTFTGICCHFDGYPSGNGKILLEHYTEEAKVQELIALGDLSSLGAQVKPSSPEHRYGNREPGVTVAYHRDRGEDFEDTAPITSCNWPIKEIKFAYNYLFCDGVWRMNGALLTAEIVAED